jgi:hypothetical protein
VTSRLTQSSCPRGNTARIAAGSLRCDPPSGCALPARNEKGLSQGTLAVLSRGAVAMDAPPGLGVADRPARQPDEQDVGELNRVGAPRPRCPDEVAHDSSEMITSPITLARGRRTISAATTTTNGPP